MAKKLTKVQVEVISGQNMPVCDTTFDWKSLSLKSSPADPFVVCTLGGVELFKTPTKQDQTNPVWNFKWSGEVDKSRGDLMFTVYDEDTFSANDWIGNCRAPIKSAIGDYSLEAPPASPPTGTKCKKKPIHKRTCWLKIKVVTEEEACCGGCSLM